MGFIITKMDVIYSFKLRLSGIIKAVEAGFGPLAAMFSPILKMMEKHNIKCKGDEPWDTAEDDENDDKKSDKKEAKKSSFEDEDIEQLYSNDEAEIPTYNDEFDINDYSEENMEIKS